MSFGGGETRSPQQIQEIEAANRMESVNFSTPSGSQGVTNPNYGNYVRQYPDLVANYERHWKKGAPEPLSQGNQGISLEEYGAMHWSQSGRNEGRVMPGISPPAMEESSGSVSSGLLNPAPQLGPYPLENIYKPILETEYTPPSAQDFSAYMPANGMLTGGAQARFPQATFPPLDPSGGVLRTGPSETIPNGQNFNIPGLLYQPYTTEYQQAYVPANIFQYDPNMFGVNDPSYRSNPYGPLALPPDWEDLIGPFSEEEEGSSSENTEPDQGSGTRK